MDRKTKRQLGGEHTNRRLPMASITKIMTAKLVIEYSDTPQGEGALEQIVLVSERAGRCALAPPSHCIAFGAVMKTIAQKNCSSHPALQTLYLTSNLFLKCIVPLVGSDYIGVQYVRYKCQAQVQ